MNKRKAALLWGATSIILGTPLAAGAQAITPPPSRAPAPTPADSGASAVSEVIVTAERRSERLENVPQSVTALSGTTIEKSGVVNITNLASIVPGVQVNFAGAATQPSIRGITSLTNAVGYENNVAIYVDGFYEPDLISINADLSNVAGIEVLKGPQGALYGRNATGGAILINTLGPAKTLTGRIDGSYATFNDRSVSGYLAGPITDRVRFSLSGSDHSSDGYIKFSPPQNGNAAPTEQQSVRLKLEADVTSKLNATFGYNYALSEDPRGVLFTTFDHRPAFLGPAPPFQTAAYNNSSVNQAITQEETVKLTLQTPIGNLSSYTGYAERDSKQDFDFDGSYQNLTYSRLRFKEFTFQQSVDYVIDVIKHLDLLVGASYYSDGVGTSQPLNRQGYGANGVLANNLYFNQRSTSYAFYLDATYHVTDALSLNVGGRYTEERKRINFLSTGTGAYPFTTATRDDNDFTPRASIRYQFAPRTNAYFSYSEGFRSGAFPTTLSNPTLLIPIAPETVKNYELGVKTAQRSFSATVAGFYSDDRNLQVAVTTPVCVGTSCTVVGITSNAPRASVYGLEGQVTYSPIDRLNLRASATYLHARYDDFTNATGTGLNAATGLNVSGQIQNWNGQQMARSPTFSANLGGDYDVILPYGDLLLAANLNYSDSYVISNPSLYGPLAGAALANKQRFRTPAYTLVNAQATWTDPTKHYYVQIFVQNLTDESYLMTFNGGSYGDYSLPNTPRQVGGKVGYRF